ncbi:olfactory receptor 1G1-like [Mixophyes fleayi]|uniref:olfactory receptor 1G1-like n=1 Tax=Mixophyes fleayi TaxID=3061075 RepID=UPI003F4E133E
MNKNWQNCTSHTEFKMVAFLKYPEIQLVIFIGVILMYLLCILGNVIIIVLVCLVSKLHTPMYFFLCNLSVLDIAYVSVILPKLLIITITGDPSISHSGCLSQLFLYVFCVGTEFFLLTTMAYDRYVAICIPLNYILIMKKKICFLLTFFSWHFGALNALMYTILISKLPLSNSHEINHFFCHMMSVLKLSCTDSTYVSVLIAVDGIILGSFSMFFIFTSYMYIISTILKIRTSSGRQKAFSRCSSHLTIVLLFCLTSLSLNIKAESEHSQEQDKVLSMIYIAVVPMLNPLVYSLRNKDILRALRNII